MMSRTDDRSLENRRSPEERRSWLDVRGFECCWTGIVWLEAVVMMPGVLQIRNLELNRLAPGVVAARRAQDHSPGAVPERGRSHLPPSRIFGISHAILALRGTCGAVAAIVTAGLTARASFRAHVVQQSRTVPTRALPGSFMPGLRSPRSKAFLLA